jgi:hypothetical protein
MKRISVDLEPLISRKVVAGRTLGKDLQSDISLLPLLNMFDEVELVFPKTMDA